MLLTILPLAALTASAFAAPLEARADCSKPLILWARGTYEGTDTSSMIPFVNDLAGSLGANSQQIYYAASFFGFFPGGADSKSNVASVNDGIAKTIKAVQDFVNSCGASSRIVLTGGSQGGQVMTDTLAGGAGQDGKLPDNLRQYIKATVVFGDPTNTVPSNYGAGNATTSGAYQRFKNTDPSFGDLNGYWAPKLRSYCTQGDPVCSGLQNQNIGAHSAEIRDWGSEAKRFVLKLFGK